MNAPWPKQMGVPVQSDGSLQTVGIRLEGVGKTYPARKGSGAVVSITPR